MCSHGQNSRYFQYNLVVIITLMWQRHAQDQLITFAPSEWLPLVGPFSYALMSVMCMFDYQSCYIIV